jgi:hypothetical protein
MYLSCQRRSTTFLNGNHGSMAKWTKKNSTKCCSIGEAAFTSSAPLRPFQSRQRYRSPSSSCAWHIAFAARHLRFEFIGPLAEIVDRELERDVAGRLGALRLVRAWGPSVTRQ